MTNTVEGINGFEQNFINNEKPKPRAGLSDWKLAVEAIGNYGLADLIGNLDPGNSASGNAHNVIAERLDSLGLPQEVFVSPTVRQFIERPEDYYSRLPDGDYYFASIRPGVHVTHATDQSEVTDFVRDFARKNTNEEDQSQELFLSHNGEPVLSGHITIQDGTEPNSIYAEFTNQDFKSFHLGYRAPEVRLRRTGHRFSWEFSGNLAPEPGDDWRTSESFVCNGEVSLTRPEIARKIFSAIQLIPHDDSLYFPGYYEVLLEKTKNAGTSAKFIEAVVAKAISACL